MSTTPAWAEVSQAELEAVAAWSADLTTWAVALAEELGVEL